MMRMRSFLSLAAAVAIVACAASLPLHAQTQAPASGSSGLPPAQPTDASLKEAHAMADTLSIPLLTRNVVQGMRNQMINATIQASGKPVDEAAKIVDEVLMPDFNAAVPELSESLLRPWAANFSAADLKGLKEFYTTPLGIRLLKTIPIVQQQTLQAGQAWGAKTFHDATVRHADELHARGLKF